MAKTSINHIYIITNLRNNDKIHGKSITAVCNYFSLSHKSFRNKLSKDDYPVVINKYMLEKVIFQE